MTTTAAHPLYSFTKADRCDACGAEAKSRAVKPERHTLQFCGHHTTKHHAAMTAQGWSFLHAD